MSGTETPNLGLQYLDPSQAQPEVKINDAWDKIDARVGEGEGVDVSNATASPPLVARALELQFEGDGVTVSHETGGKAIITIPGGGGTSSDTHSDSGGSPISVSDGTTTVTDVTEILFSGATVTASGRVAQVAISGGGGGGGASAFNITPDSHTDTPTFVANDEFEGSGLDTAGTRFSGAEPWTWSNSSAATLSVADGSLLLNQPADGTFNAILQPLASGSAWRYQSKALFYLPNGYNNCYPLVLRESSSDKIAGVGPQYYNGVLSIIFGTGTLAGGITANPYSSAMANYFSEFIATVPSIYLYWELELAAGTIYARVSRTGLPGTFINLYNVAATTDFTTAPNQIGFATRAYTGSGHFIALDWFRRMA